MGDGETCEGVVCDCGTPYTVSLLAYVLSLADSLNYKG